nr:histidinol-phosphate aminotransferase family protein [Clostridia bacterium]
MIHGGNVWEGNPARWLDFSANLRPEGTPLWVMDAMQSALADVRYYPDRAMVRARRGLAAYTGVPEACILPTAGGAAAIDLVLTLRKGQVLTLHPTFCEYAERAAVHGRLNGLWQGECAPDDTVFIANPNNPTGTAMPREKLLALHQHVMSRGGEMIVDEAFIDFCPEHSVCGDVQSGLTVVGSMTKTLCIPGVRLGYICAAPEAIAILEKQMLTWSLCTLATEIAAHLPEHLAEIRQDAAINRVRRAKFAQQLADLGAHVQPSQANFLLVDFKQDMTDIAAALKTSGILVRTCTSFGLPGNVLRLAVKTEEENNRLIHELGELLHAR